MPRCEFPNPVKRAANERANGICECHRIKKVPGIVPGGCNQKLAPGNCFYEHIHPDAAGGRPTLDNCAVLTKTCWKIKSATFDQPLAAKVKRQRDRNQSINRKPSRPMPCGRFSAWKKPMNAWNAERRL